MNKDLLNELILQHASARVLADKIGVEPSCVSNWKSRGISPKGMYLLYKAGLIKKKDLE